MRVVLQTNPYNSKTMKNSLYHQARLEAVLDLFGGLTFDQVTTTAEWDALTCDDQMTIKDLIG